MKIAGLSFGEKSPEIFRKTFNINWLIINITLETIRSCLFLNCFLKTPFGVKSFPDEIGYCLFRLNPNIAATGTQSKNAPTTIETRSLLKSKGMAMAIDTPIQTTAATMPRNTEPRCFNTNLMAKSPVMIPKA